MTIQAASSFDLLIDRVGNKYRAHIVNSEFGETSTDFDLPFLDDPALEPDGVARACRDLRRRLVRKELRPQVFGRRLFEAAFQGSIGSIFRQCHHTAQSRNEMLRIRLRLAKVPELGALPWETLYDPQRGQFLALEEGISIVRYLDCAGRFDEWRIEGPLRVLAVVSSPLGLGKLDVEQEWRNLNESFEPLLKAGRVILDLVRRGTLEAVLEHLEKAPYHVLHFIGHGTFNQDKDSGELIFESEDGGRKHLDAHRLATIVRPREALRLVVLNVCEGARQSTTDAFSGLSQSLLRQGVPAVIGMQQKISDRAAIHFARAFYDVLSVNGSLDVAVTVARTALYRDEGPGWALPALFLRSMDSKMPRLVDVGDRPTGGGSSTIRPLLLSARQRSGGRPRRLFFAAAIVTLVGGLLVARLLSPDDARCPSPNGVDMELVYLAGGEFTMGTEIIEKGEHRPGLAAVEDFCIGKYEVTRSQWQQLMGDDLADILKDDASTNAPRRPAVVDWEEAMQFIGALNDSNAGDRFSLPTEAQWEYAARAGSRTAFSFGDDRRELELYGNCQSLSGADGFDGTAPVGSFKPNAWGLFDMHGNVREWVIPDPPIDAAESTASRTPGPLPPEDAGKYSARGGSFNMKVDNCRSASRARLNGDNPGDTGFRVVYNFPPKSDP